MTTFLRLLAESDKAAALLEVCARQRAGVSGQWSVNSGQKGGDPRIFEVAPSAFDTVPGKPFAYWVSEAVRETFRRLPAFEGEGRTVRVGLQTGDDFRFVCAWWETGGTRALFADGQDGPTSKWFPFAKGGAYSPLYADVYLMVNWARDGLELDSFTGSVIRNPDFYHRPGLTWPLRAYRFAPQALPEGCIFSVRGYCAFPEDGQEAKTLGIFNSAPFDFLFKTALGRFGYPEFIVGILQIMPWAETSDAQGQKLAALARRAWSLKRTLDTVNETSHAFLLPAALRTLTPTPLPEGEGLELPSPSGRRAGDESATAYNPPAINAELVRIQADIDAIAFDLYGFCEADRQATLTPTPLPGGEGLDLTSPAKGSAGDAEASDEDEDTAPIDQSASLLSWAVGVAFGRFDWRLATGERAAPPEPEPFDPLPAKSPGMLPDGAAAFHAHPGILVDDQGHPHDLTRLIEAVLDEVFSERWSVAGKTPRTTDHGSLTTDHGPLSTNHGPLTTDHGPLTTDHWPLNTDIRRWLQRDFFTFHLQRYSKSRRKAPIYWPLSTTSGSYTLWLYYPNLTSQTLYTAINDFIEPKLKQVGADVTVLRNKGSARTRDDEKQFEALQAFELELIELRDTLLKLAPTYKPNHDDGVQISAAPLWPLFRHKPWQKVLKDTWAKLEKGDYDWAHLAMNYWPERVREKCKTDKSLAIAHGLEALYIEPEAKPKKTRGRKKAE